MEDALGPTRWVIAEGPEPVPPDTDYASVSSADRPIVVQHSRLDSRQVENALMTTIAFPAD